MRVRKHLDELGPADIKLATLEIWVHGREFPKASDYWDANWLTVTARCAAEWAVVWIYGPVIHLSDIADWAEKCETLYRTLSGEATLVCIEPNLSVHLHIKKRGELAMIVEITPNNATQQHTFHFDIDQSYLPDFINSCRRVLADFPIKGQPNGIRHRKSEQ
jgi:hypothetical protein